MRTGMPPALLAWKAGSILLLVKPAREGPQFGRHSVHRHAPRPAGLEGRLNPAGHSRHKKPEQLKVRQ